MQQFQIYPQERALLDVIASTEAPGYNVVYGGDTFDSFADHPRIFKDIISGPNEGKKTSAAGRYQFLSSTWDEMASSLGLSDFRPASQDMAAVALARRDYRLATGRSLTHDLSSNDPSILANIGKVLSSTWTSLPSGIEQGQNADTFVSRFRQALGSPGTSVNQSISTSMSDAAKSAGSDLATELAATKSKPVDYQEDQRYISPILKALIEA